MKKSKTLLIASIVGTLCVVYLFLYMGNSLNDSMSKSSATQIGTTIAATIATPSMILSAISTIFAWVGWATNKRGFALTSGILYAVAIVFMIPWFMFNIVQMILCFVAYGIMGKNNG